MLLFLWTGLKNKTERKRRIFFFSPCQIGYAIHDYEKKGTQRQKFICMSFKL